jgi:hypothetical protein
MISRFLETRPRIDQALSAIDKNRLKLPVLSASSYFDGFDAAPVVFHELPSGAWSSPVVDVLMLAKIVACTRPGRLLEVGSFRGYTALMLARHMPEEARLVTVDPIMAGPTATLPWPPGSSVASPRCSRRPSQVTRQAALISFSSMPGIVITK